MKLTRLLVLVIFCLFGLIPLKAQNNNGSIDAVGDIAFVAFHDNDDGFAFVLLDDCTAGQVIRFIDEGWTGSAFASVSSEGEVTWTNSTGSTISKGTVITITDADDNGAGISANQGTAVEAESGFSTGVTAEQIYAVTGTRASPGTFLSAIGNLALDGATVVTLSGTGLTDGTNALNLGDGEARYTGSTSFSGTLSAVASDVNTLGSWSIASFTFPSDVVGDFTGSTFGGDTDPPVVSSITVSGSPGAADASMTFSVDFDENANNVSTDDFTVSTASGTATGTVSAVSASTGDPITVTVSSITGTGSIRLDLKASTNITDDTGNGNGTNGNVAAFSSGATHTVDRDAPSAPSTPDMTTATDSGNEEHTAGSTSDNLTNNQTPTFEGTAEAGSTVNLISNVDGNIGSATATGGNWSIMASTLTAGAHTITATATDAAGNTSGSSSGLSINIDVTQPTVTITTTSTDPTNDNPIPVTITFNSEAENMKENDLTVVNGTTGDFASADSTSFTVNITPAGNGNVQVSVGAGRAFDQAGNSNTTSNTLSLDYDGTGPTLINQALAQTDSDDLQVTYQSNETGTLYYVVTTNSSTPTQAQVKAGNDQSGTSTNVVSSGNAAVTVTGSNQTIALNGLTLASTTYHLFIYEEDAVGNESSVVTNSAAVDATAPTLTNQALAQTASNALQITYQSNETGTLYYVVTTNSSTPTQAQILAGNDQSGTSTNVVSSGNAAVTVTGSNQTIALNGLTLASTTYHLFIYEEDAINNQSSVVTNSAAVDATAPTLTNQALAQTASNTLQITYQSNETGTLYYVVTTNSSTPTQAQILAGNDQSGTSTNVVSSGTAAVTVTGSNQTIALNGLTLASTTYHLFIYEEDAVGNQSSVVTNSSAVDATAPTLINQALAQTASNALQITYQSNETGTLYYVVTTNSSTPTQAQILAGNDQSGTSTNVVSSGNAAVTVTGSDQTIALNGLTLASTTYHLFIYEEDAINNQSSVVTNSATIDNTAPTLINQALAQTDSDDLQITYQSNETGTLYYVVTTNSSTPTQAQILAGNDQSGTSTNVVSSGTAAVTVTGSNQTIALNGLTLASTTYHLFIYEEDAVGNQSSVVTNSAAVDATAPTLTNQALAQTDSDDLQITYQSNETGTLYYVVTTNSSTPTQAQILAGNDQSGTSTNVVSSGNAAVTVTGSNQTIALNGLTLASTTYHLFIYEEDAINNQSSVVTNSAAVDATAPTVTGVSSTTADGTYKVGDAIAVTVTFSENVTVTGTPQLTLETGTTDRTINYASGSGGTTLTFNYTVQTGDVSADLDYVGTSSLALNSGTIKDGAGNDATLTLATPGAANSLGANKAIVIDGVAPTVTSVSSTTANGTYKVGDVIAVTVTFSENVTVTGTPQLTLETGTTDRTVDYASGSGGSTLTFNYTVQTGDVSADLDYVGTSSLALNSGTINDGAGNAATLTLASPGAANSLGANKAIVIDGVAPTVSFVSSVSANGTYKVGDVINVNVSFSEAITVTGTPQIELETGTTDRQVNYTSGSGNNSLFFSYTVQAGDVSADLDYKATNSLTLNGGGLKDAAGNDAVLTLPAPGATNSLGANKAHVVDGVVPTVTSVSSSTANGNYKAGDVIAVTVTFSENVTVTGTPQLTLETGTTDRTVNYTSGSGGTILTFNYTVQSGDVSADLDYTGTNSLALNGGTINDGAGNAATLTLATPGAANSLGANKALVIDGIAPTISSTSPADDGTDIGIGDNITITFSEDIAFGTGNIEIIDLTDASNTVTIDAASPGSQASISGATLTLNPTNSLDLNSNYAVQIAATAIDDLVGNSYAGITDNTTLNFTTINTAVAFDATSSNAAESTVSVNLPVSLNAASGVTVTVDYAVTGTASGSGTDYTLADGTLTFNPGSTSENITIAGIVDDAIVETNETVIVTLSNPTNAGLGTNQVHTYTINNNDFATVTIADVTAAENSGSQSITATLDKAVQGGFAFDVFTTDGTATTADSDYSSTAGSTLTFTGTAGETQSLNLQGLGDTKVEADETFTISMTNLGFTAVTTNEVDITDAATYTITNDDAASIAIGDVTKVENADGATTTFTFTTTLTGSVDQAFTVDYATSDGSASAGSDYTATSGTLTFAGNTSGETQTFSVTVSNDDVVEADETFTVTLSNLQAGGKNGTISDATATGTITNDDAATVAFNATASSGSEATASTNLQVDLSTSSDFTITVDYAVTGTATGSGTDYTLANGTLTFTAGDVSENITIASIVDDALDEVDETVIVTLSNPSNATLGTNTVHTYTIQDNDDAPTVEFGLATDGQAESEPSQDLPIGLSAVSSKTITVDYAATGTATGSGTDYTFANGTFTFDPGDQNLTLQLTGIIDDLLDEDDETIILTLSNPANATLGAQTTLTYTIQDNDAEPTVTLSVDNNSIAENAGTSAITATLSAVSGRDVTVNLGYSGTATSGTDYNNTASTSITISAGNTSAGAVVGITAIDDTDGEGAETIIVDITGVTNGSESGTQQQTITIIDDDDITPPSGYSVTMDDALINATEATASTFTFAGAEVGATYNYTVSSDGGGTDVTGTGTITTATDQITLADLSGLSDGTLTLSVTLTDPSGNIGATANDGASKDATAPTAPVVSSITDDTGSNGADQITSDNTPDVNGTAEANSTVEVFVDGVSVGTTNADGSGNWTMVYNGTSARADGSFDVTANATDAAGNISATSSALSVTVDTAAPDAPVVSTITDDTGANGTDQNTNDATLSFSGTAEANATIEVFIDGTSIGTTTADGAGQWIFNHEGTTLADAVYSVTAKATDAAGNTSVESSALSVTVDTVAPAAPTVDLDAAFDTGASDSDDLTNATTLKFNGTAEANADVEVFINDVSFGVTAADVVGAWTLTTSPLTLTGEISVKAIATDQVGNTGAASQVLTVTIDTEVTSPTLSPADNATDILPTTDLVLTFAEDVVKSGNNISIRKSSDDSILESFDVSSSKVTVSGSTVTIDLENTLPPATEVYVTIGQGAVVDQAGNDYAGISNTTDWSFTTIAASVVSNVVVPDAGTYGIGDNLDFTITMVLPVTVTGTPTIPITIGGSVVNASLVGSVTNSSTLVFRYTVLESELDADGIAVGSAINLNGGTMKDAFDVNAILGLNNVASTAAVLVDGVRPIPTLSTSASAVVNDPFTVTLTYDESVGGFEIADITVANGTAASFTEVIAGKSWSAEITPTVAGDVVVSLAAGVAADLAGNTSAAGSNSISRQFNNNPTDISLSSMSIDERNDIGDEVGTFSTTDVDVTDTHTYSLVSGTGDADNASFTIDGNSLKAAAVFDFETRDSYSIRVRTDDGANGGIFEKAFTITISNVGEAVIVVDGDGAFEMTVLGFSDTKTWTVTNTGDASTEVRVINTTTAFSVDPGSLIVGPGESKDVTAVFTPQIAQQYNGQIVFNYNIADTEQASVVLPVNGEGVIVTSTDDDLARADVKFSPNPANTTLYIELPNRTNVPIDIQMTDINGQPVFERGRVTETQISIDVSSFTSGIYIVVLNDGKSVLRKKVMIKR
ncbi:hypothetical protein BFP97_01770 [Roseivirga sp. 4D4]|uniref:Ig-like domain-containing protein n=1 Tax=Roseivirga sp. 4D4 TaxID=1889784 RepID=UPI000852CBC8|nr:Ig-like domain-containing protein [Roseivirga sp. 4D4]OEK00317.1 hypothetical protein BFP97_01770 [Roseivirga sp. 4D4]